MGDMADYLMDREQEAWDIHNFGMCGEFGICQYCEHEENNMQQGRIEAAKKSQSGKSVSLTIDGKYYSTKNWDMEGMVGQTVTFNATGSEFPPGSGKMMYWIDDYGIVGGPADQAMNQAMNQPPPMGQPAPQPGPGFIKTGTPQNPAADGSYKSASARDRDSSIIAQALTKACTAPGDPVEKVWSRYMSFYRYASGEGSPAEYEDVPY